MVETIIQSLNRQFPDGTQGAESNLLKFNSAMRKLGIKKIKVGEDLHNNTIEDELTLYISPYFSSVEYSNRSSGRDSFVKFYEYLISLSGSEGFREYYQMRPRTMETQELLRVTFNNAKFEIGDYIRERNIILICLPLNFNYFKLEKNEYLDKFIEWLQEAFAESKVKEVDTQGLKRKFLLRKYMVLVENKLNETRKQLQYTQNDVENYKRDIVSCYSRIKVCEMDIKSLEKNREDLEGNLLKQIEEIKELTFVKEVKFEDIGIKVLFEKIFIKVKNKDIEMGEYEITINPNNIKIINRQPIVYCGTTYHSCHISGDNICFGNEKTMAYELLGKMELKKLTHFLYLYLKTYNPEDTYLSMNYWIKGKENGGEVSDDDIHEGQEYCNQCDEYVDEEDFDYDSDMCYECARNEEEGENE